MSSAAPSANSQANDNSQFLRGICSDWSRPRKANAESLAGAIAELRGFGDDHFAPDPRKDPFYPHVKKFAAALFSKVKPGMRVFVSADYDTDGVVSLTMLCELFRQLGVTPIANIPDRITDGYGVDYDEACRNFEEEPYGALVTTDCGSADLKRMGDFAAKYKVPVFILDHHKIAEARELPQGVHELNPSTDESLNVTHYCAGTLAFMLACAVVDMHPKFADREIEFACLGGLAAIVDVSSSLGLANRYAMRCLLKHGSKGANNGIRGLFAVAEIKGEATTADIGFRVGPLINAAGRLQHASTAFSVFDSSNLSEACEGAEKLKELNQRRKVLQEAVVSDALKAHAANPKRVLVAWSTEWHPGVVGPAAGTIAEQLNIPVFLGAYIKESEKITFSARASQGADVYSLVAQCATGLDIQFGGHKAAMGMRFPYTREGTAAITELADRMDKVAPDPVRRIRAIDRYLTAATVSWRNHTEVRKLEPFDTIGNSAPVVCIPNVKITLSEIGQSGTTLKGVAEDDAGHSFVCIAFRNRALQAAKRSMRCHVVGEIVSSSYANRPVLQILIHDLIPAG